MAETLVQRLRAMYSHRGDGIPTQQVNPDGWEAADEIERLTAEVGRYRAALLAIDDTAKWHSSTEARDVCILARQALACKGGG